MQFVYLMVLVLSCLVLPAQAAPQADGVEETAVEVVPPGEAEFDELEALKQKAAKEGEWEMGKEEQIPINQQVLLKTWNKVPFDPKPFDYTPEQIRENWDELMSGFRMPYISAESLRGDYQRYPQLKERHKNFDGDFDRLERELNDVWRLFMRGDFQASMRRGESLGPMGMLSGKVAQIFYAIYLEPNLEHKHMLLQDSANVIREFGTTFEQMKKSSLPASRANYVVARLAYIYAIGRIAEDVPIPVAIARNYPFKVLGAIDDVKELAPDNPLGIAASAGADANVVRKVGKATGRITFGARQATIRSDFERALKGADLAVIRYEYGNAILYLNKKRDIEEAMGQYRRAAATRPRFAIEALDAMYAVKRLREVEAWNKSTASFRSFERKRLKYQKDNNINLYCVLPDTCKPFIIN